MESSSPQKSLRTLTLALIFSGALNISLIVAGVVSSMSERSEFEIPTRSSLSKGEDATNRQLLADFSKLGFRELATYLTNRDPVEQGYTKRDLALAVLVGHHYFNLEKALGCAPTQERTLELGEGKTLAVFPGLNDEQYEAILHHAYEEKWPLTAQGLFHLLKKSVKPRDASLEQAFCITPEFYTLQTLFQKTGATQPASLLLDLVCQGNWDLLSLFAKEQSQLLDLSVDKRRRLLLSYLTLHSPLAAEILLSTDFSFALNRLEDQGILSLMSLLSQGPQSEKFCIELLKSPRSDLVWRASAAKLYAFAGEAVTGPIDLKAAVARFTGARQVPSPPAASQPVERPLTRTHVVKEGESLWKIARQYKVNVKEIVQLNGLEQERLYPGMTLQIPQSSGSEPPR